MGAFEGDLVRPLGFVTLYFAYAEGQLDEVLKVLIQASGESEPKVQSFGTKVGEANRLVASIGISRLPGLSAILQTAKPLIEARNELVHGQLFNGGQIGGHLISRAGTRNVTPEEIEGLAESILSWKEQLCALHRRELEPLVFSIVAERSAAKPDIQSDVPAAGRSAAKFQR